MHWLAAFSWGRIRVFIFLTLLLAQFSVLSGIIYSLSNSRAIVSATDDDAGVVVYKATITRWYKDNGWAPYGPLYFRMAHTVASFFDALGGADQVNRADQGEANHHFFLMWISLLSLYGLCALLAYLVAPSLESRVFSTVVLVSLFLLNEVWTQFVFRAHPDLLLSLLIGAMAFAAFLSWQNPLVKSYRQWTAVLFGLAASTKLSIILFFPAVAVFCWYGFRRETWERFKSFCGWALGAYFLIGFPQNFVVDRPIRFLLKQSSHSAFLNWAAFSEWWMLWYQQFIFPALALIFFIFFFGRKNAKAPFPWIRFFAFCFLPFVLLISRRVTSPHEYYTLPFVASHLVFWTVGLSHLPFLQTVREILVRFWDHFFVSVPSLSVVILVLFGWIFSLVPSNVKEVAAAQQECRSEAKLVYEKIQAYQKMGKPLLLDPYVPYSRVLGQPNVSWETTSKLVEETNPEVMVFSRRYFSRYLTSRPSEYVERETKAFDELRSFYQSFDVNDPVVEKASSQWQRVHQDSCGWLIWEKTN